MQFCYIKWREPKMAQLCWKQVCISLLCFILDISFSQQANNIFGMNYFRSFTRSKPSYYENEYDFIVIGGGNAGCVVASRLSEIFDWKILLLEAGTDENFFTNIPIMASYFLSSGYNWWYRSEPNPAFCRGMEYSRCRWNTGKALGGSTVINYMLYVRGNKKDYDLWRDLGNSGWGYEDVLPYFLKSENILINEFRNSPFHSVGGYVDVQYAGYRSPLAPLFLKAGSNLGYSVNDPNGNSQLGFSYVQASLRNGARLTSSAAYLGPARNRTNLHIIKEALVTKILINPKTKRTYGVEYVKDKRVYVVKVRREVILSAGALNSPKLLMLSGVGPREHLQELGINVISDLKVGQFLQDHVAFGGLTFVVNESVSIVENRLLFGPSYTFQYLTEAAGPLTLPGGAEGLAFVKTPRKREDVPEDVADMELVFSPGALSGDIGGSLRKAFDIKDSLYRQVFKSIEGKDAFGIVPVLLKPRSRGYMKLRSNNPHHPPLLYPNYFSDERDLEDLVEGIKMAVAVGENVAFAKYNSTLHRVPYPGCEDIPFGSNDYWSCAARQLTINLQHQSGSCKMGPVSDPESVVDHELKVHGVHGLRVADTSIIPDIPSGHTMAAAYMIGEKASDMIKKSWRKA